MTTKLREIQLPAGLVPVALSREQAAAYLGISPGLFDRGVSDGLIPKPKPIYGRMTWDRAALDKAYAALPDVDGNRPGANSWDAA